MANAAQAGHMEHATAGSCEPQEAHNTMKQGEQGETPAIAGLRRAQETVQENHAESGSLTRMPAKLPPSLEQRFDLLDGSDLGEGSVAVVRRIQDKRDGQVLALKVMEKHPLLIRNMAQQVHREVKLQNTMRHPNVLRLFDFLEDDTHIYMLLELAGHGGLLGLMRRFSGGHLSEAVAGWLYAQIVEGVDYLHGQGCAHRDLKPDNILLGQSYCPKVSDFGWCVDMNEGSPRMTTCGTLDYMAPEVLLNEGHDMAVDLWSLGVMLYEMLSGHTPFMCTRSRSSEEFIEKVNKVEYPFPPWFSNEACHLVHCLLQRQPSHRIITSRVLSHQWIGKFYTTPKQAGRPPLIEPPKASEEVTAAGIEGTSGSMVLLAASSTTAQQPVAHPVAVAVPSTAPTVLSAPPACCRVAKSHSRSELLSSPPPRSNQGTQFSVASRRPSAAEMACLADYGSWDGSPKPCPAALRFTRFRSIWIV